MEQISLKDKIRQQKEQEKLGRQKTKESKKALIQKMRELEKSSPKPLGFFNKRCPLCGARLEDTTEWFSSSDKQWHAQCFLYPCSCGYKYYKFHAILTELQATGF